MKKLLLVLLVVTLAFCARAQETNTLKTSIENFEAQTNILIVKGFGLVGSVAINDATTSVYTKESSDVLNGQKIYGLNVSLAAEHLVQFAIMDEDEIAPLLDSLDYLSKISYGVTTLPAFDAEFSTKSGLRFSAHSSRRQGGIQYYLEFPGNPKIPLTTEQLTQIRNLIAQGRESINALKK